MSGGWRAEPSRASGGVLSGASGGGSRGASGGELSGASGAKPRGDPSGGRGELPRHALASAGAAGPPIAVEPFGAVARASFPHRHDFFEIAHATAGAGVHVVDFAPHPLRPRTLWVLVPGQVHRWECTTPVDGRLVLFGEELLLDGPAHLGALDELAALHALAAAGPIALDAAAEAAVTAQLDALQRECAAREQGWGSVARAHLHVLIVLAQRARARAEARLAACAAASGAALPPQQVGRGTALARQFLRLVNERLVATPTVHAYASRLGVTPGHLADTVREATGRTPGELIRGRDTLEAKRLLAHTDLTVAEIADRLGFDDPSYFGRFFKREAGESPGGFRSRVRERCQSDRERSLGAPAQRP